MSVFVGHTTGSRCLCSPTCTCTCTCGEEGGRTGLSAILRFGPLPTESGLSESHALPPEVFHAGTRLPDGCLA
ncbi:hypothetical protein [uncultured Bifidobacterium sp.]|uniref:hypothetical protein n=1 Tax=uncultured Bifidobacterium sp. TaxID=165187 RepID=UPI0028DBBC5B|nr:hypothetical protein [uncultured Bifidobacterium sp.]